MIAAIYARVSTADQDNSLQIAELTKYCESRGWRFVVYQDQMTGSRNDRPGLKELMEAARRRLVDVVVVWKLDRFGRSTSDLLNNIRELEGLGVRFLAVTQGLDTDHSSPVSRFLLVILGAVAELEREMITERVRAGVDRAKKRGVKFGRPKTVVDRQRAADLLADGLSVREVANRLKVSRGVISRLFPGGPKVPRESALAKYYNGTESPRLSGRS